MLSPLYPRQLVNSRKLVKYVIPIVVSLTPGKNELPEIGEIYHPRCPPPDPRETVNSRKSVQYVIPAVLPHPPVNSEICEICHPSCAPPNPGKL